MDNKLGYESLSHPSAMKERILRGAGTSRSNPIGRNFRKIPDILSFRIEVKGHDRQLLSFGLTKREDPVIRYLVYRNRDLNRYMEHQLIRMAKADEKTYWRIARFLMCHSRVFFIITLNHVFPTWYKSLPLKSVVRYYKRMQKLVFRLWDPEDRVSMSYARVYIEKGGGKGRPLGVPSPVWRILSTMLASLLSFRFAGQLDARQHAYRPGKSTLTAWGQILSEVLTARNIFEFDLMGFFDNVRGQGVIDWLMRRGCPLELLRLVRKLAASAVTLPKELRLQEDRQFLKGAGGVIPMSVAYRADVSGHEWSVSEYDDPVGFPQGAAFSPFLSIIALERSLYDLNPGLVQYADDGIFYGDGPLCLDPREKDRDWEFLAAGLQFSAAKSHWVRKDGEGRRPIKFLGYLYIPADHLLVGDGVVKAVSPGGDKAGSIPEIGMSKTRSGKSLIYDKDKLLLQLYLQDSGASEPLDPLGSSAPETRFSGEMLVKSRLAGLIQSRMYSGTWEVEEGLLKGVGSLVRGSGARRVANRSDPGIVTLANASSLASRSLLSLLKRVTSKPALHRPLETYVWERWYVQVSRQRVSGLSERVSLLSHEIDRLGAEVRETVEFLRVLESAFADDTSMADLRREGVEQLKAGENERQANRKRPSGRCRPMSAEWEASGGLSHLQFIRWFVDYYHRALKHSRYTFEQNCLHTCRRYVDKGLIEEEREAMATLLSREETFLRVIGHERIIYQQIHGS